MLIRQLSNGLLIDQDVAASVRLPLFSTGNPEFPHWTNGGTVFFVQFESSTFGITCRHILGSSGNFGSWRDLRIANFKTGPYCLPIETVFTGSEPWGHVDQSDILDIAVLKVARSELVTGAYYLSEGTVCQSDIGDHLVAHGTAKERCDLSEPEVKVSYCHLGFVDEGPHPSDLSLRSASAVYSPQLPYKELAGLSGAPVQNVTKNALAGVVTRGQLKNSANAKIHYVGVSHIAKLVRAAASGGGIVRYLQHDPPFSSYQKA